jgi:ubiquinone/menaquinone biosynthesis C-methylase UbiE
MRRLLAALAFAASPLAAVIALEPFRLAADPTAAEEQRPQTQPQTQPHQQHDAGGHDATVSHSFEDVDRWVDVFDAPSRAEWQKPDQIPGALGLEEGMAIADIGAGTGYFERFFAAAVGASGKVYAVDIEPKMVAYLEQRAKREKTPQVLAVLAAPDDPRLPEGGLDVVFICDTYHHIDDRVGYIRRLGKVLKPGGRVAIVDFQKRELPVGPPPEHKLAREEVIEEFALAGWVLARESDILPYQYFLIFRPPQAGR